MSAEASDTQARYTLIAITLHWLIALAILMQIYVGFWMSDAIEEPAYRAAAYKAFQLHKSVGLTILLLSLLRLGWRLGHKQPPMPVHMPAWEKIAAHATHWGFYAIMIAAPLTGWLYVSTGWNIENGRPFSVPTVWFGLFQVPHIPGLESLPNAARGSAAESFMEVHELLAFVTLALFALHVLAALKHHLLDRDDVLTRMLPFLKPLGRTAS